MWTKTDPGAGNKQQQEPPRGTIHTTSVLQLWHGNWQEPTLNSRQVGGVRSTYRILPSLFELYIAESCNR